MRAVASLRVRFVLNALFVTTTVTNWMTVTGVAMILGGISIPIWFRREIFGVGGKRRVRGSHAPRAIEPPRRAQLTAVPEGVVDSTDAAPGGGPGRRARVNRWSDLDDRDAEGRFRYGLASIGLADDEDAALDDGAVLELDGRDRVFHEAGDDPGFRADEVSTTASAPDGDGAERADPANPIKAREPGAIGDRVNDWVRPQYRELPKLAGAYWTPPPEAAQYAEPYGWPVPVERLPAVLDYEPATGLDLVPASEPTAVVPQWPPANRERQHTWTEPGEKERHPQRRAVMIRRTRRSEPIQAQPSAEDEAQDPRPRPRPRPSTVYVSRHAAE